MESVKSLCLSVLSRATEGAPSAPSRETAAGANRVPAPAGARAAQAVCTRPLSEQAPRSINARTPAAPPPTRRGRSRHRASAPRVHARRRASDGAAPDRTGAFFARWQKTRQVDRAEVRRASAWQETREPPSAGPAKCDNLPSETLRGRFDRLRPRTRRPKARPPVFEVVPSPETLQRARRSWGKPPRKRLHRVGAGFLRSISHRASPTSR